MNIISILVALFNLMVGLFYLMVALVNLMVGLFSLMAALVNPHENSHPTVDNHGNTPLHIAIIFGNSDLARSLLYNGASVSATDDYNRTPLHAVHMCVCPDTQFELLELLLENGADANAKDKSGNTILHLFSNNIEGSNKLRKVLLKSGADATQPNDGGYTPNYLLGL